MPSGLEKLSGILTVTLTPFSRQGDVDFDAYGRLLDFVTANGVHYIIPCGTTGEYYNLTTDERRAILKFVKENIKGRMQLLAGTNSQRPAEIVELSSPAMSKVASAQARKPCAVSRKKTPSVCRLTHLVRRRPAM